MVSYKLLFVPFLVDTQSKSSFMFDILKGKKFNCLAVNFISSFRKVFIEICQMQTDINDFKNFIFKRKVKTNFSNLCFQNVEFWFKMK